MEVTYYTHRGNIRSHNEDALLINDILISEKSFSTFKKMQMDTIELDKNLLFIVADGIGGHSKGELASFLVLDFLRQNKNLIISKELLLQKLHESKLVLNDYVNLNPHVYGLGTVIAGILFLEKDIVVFNIGDCRVYKYKDNILIRLSKDHSVVEELKDSGYITEEEARIHPEKHIITSAIIGNGKKFIDKIYLKVFSLEEFFNSIILICSDGLWEILSNKELQSCMEYVNLDSIAQCLINKAFMYIVKDNISFILIKI